MTLSRALSVSLPALLAGVLTLPPGEVDAQSRGVRATRSSSGAVRRVPVAPRGVPRLPVAGTRRGVGVHEVFLRQVEPRRVDPWAAPVLEWRDDRDRFGDPRRFEDSRRRGDSRRFRDSHPFRDSHRFDGRHAPGCSGAGDLRVAVGSDGVRIGVGSAGHRSRYGSYGTGCRRDRRGGILILPYGAGGTVITGGYGGSAGGAGIAHGDAYAAGGDATEPAPGSSSGYHATNAGGTAFTGSGGRFGVATGCAAVTVRMRGGEWYGAEIRLPALGTETPEALAAALRARHRHGRSTVLRGFDGASLGIPAGPAVEAVEVVACR